jgi:hypothetical protein
MTLKLNKHSSGRDVLKFALTVLREQIDTEMNLLKQDTNPHTTDMDVLEDIGTSMQRIYNAVKSIGIMYGITEKELRNV